MKHTKSRSGTGGCGSGVTGIAGNYAAYQRWVRTTHERSKYVESTLIMADMLNDSDLGTSHRDTRPAEIKKSEQEVSDTIDAINEFIDPFSIDDKNNLYCITSGSRVPSEYEYDILQAGTMGKQAKEAFMVERLEKHDNFFEPIKET
ncbi:hypothetical protein ACF0H5_013052 [Mactra antiquata]